MGKLYEAAQQINDVIERKGLDPFKTKGAISMRTGFLLSFVTPEDPDDDARIQQLKEVAYEVLGERILA
ncbi:MAG: hypothetical protein Q7W30_02160 [Coriobacteriia bacterium]|nr:hypothetical protein [Coriobacteriia bacterium]